MLPCRCLPAEQPSGVAGDSGQMIARRQPKLKPMFLDMEAELRCLGRRGCQRPAAAVLRLLQLDANMAKGSLWWELLACGDAQCSSCFWSHNWHGAGVR